ncbi:hypothetical protein ACFIOY_34815 [Bradyrhizobium sp. TZ2]
MTGMSYHHLPNGGMPGPKLGNADRPPVSPRPAGRQSDIGYCDRQSMGPVRAEVVAATRSKQVPWSISSLPGDVDLVEK